MIRRWILPLIATACTLVVLVPPAPATGAPNGGVAAFLAAHPGGVPINDNEISYGGGAFVVTLAQPPGTLAAPDCPSGWFCFYDRVNYGYPRGRLSSCGTQDLGTWGWQYRTDSAHYNMSSGTATFFYSSTRIFAIGVNARTAPDVTPYRNWADRVTRSC
jgi:hypothetical protein